MTRVLHVLDQAGPIGEAAALRLSMDWVQSASCPSNEQHAWLLVGGQPMRDAAEAVGLDPDACVLLPRPKGLSAWLPGALNKLERVIGQADRVVCWNRGAGTLLTSYSNASIERRYDGPDRVALARPIIEAQRNAIANPSDPDRQALRQGWGVAADQIVIAFLADRPWQIDLLDGFMTLAMLAEAMKAQGVAEDRWRLVCHPHVLHADDAVVLADGKGLHELILQDDRMLTPWQVLAGCDIALTLDPTHTTLSILWANRFGLPVVTPPKPDWAGLMGLPHVATARSHAPKHLAHTLTQWAKARPAPAASTAP